MSDQSNAGQSRPDNLADSSKFKPMVQWFSPALLAGTGFKSMVAKLFGQYADQRIIQHLADPVLVGTEDTDNQTVFAKVAGRYDYSTEVVGSEPFWVDYTADMGDGFDPTYGVCHTISQGALYGENKPKKANEIAVKDWHGDEPLPGGRLLILGGDEIYPYPTPSEYETRFSNPFRLALPGDGSENCDRDLYAIPGNHDWYDGLTAFQGLFCGASDGAIPRQGKCIGGWRTRQHRSYFAIKLPYNWWIWGADIHLTRSLDDGQLEYFQAVANTMGPGDKFILCTAQPSWYYFNTDKEQLARENLHSLIDMPIEKGAKLHGIFSGDTHHYARYNESEELGNFNLFTAGGGGAYTHGTYHLSSEIEFPWLGRLLKFQLDRKLEPGKASDEAPAKPKLTDKPAVYPSKLRSKAIAWASILMPFRNFSFALAIGMIYLLLTWTFSVIPVEYNPNLNKSDLAAKPLKELTEQFKTRGGLRKLKPAPVTRTVDSETGDIVIKHSGKEAEEQIIGGWTLDLIDIFRARIASISANATTGTYVVQWLGALAILLRQGMDLLLLGIAASPASFAILLALWFALYSITQTKLSGLAGSISRLVTGTFHFAAHLFGMWILFCIFLYINFNILKPWLVEYGISRILGAQIDFWIPFLTAIEMIPLGGILGGMIFGLYLALGYRFGKVNDDWTFSAQRITQFKCFLRMRFEPDKLTIYPIGIDDVPTRTGMIPAWKWSENRESGEPKLQPKTPITARLIEGPIVIRSSDVRNIPRSMTKDSIV